MWRWLSQGLEARMLGHSVSDWLIAFAATTVITLLLAFIKRRVTARFARFAAATRTQIDDLVAKVLCSPAGAAYLALYLAILASFVKIPSRFEAAYSAMLWVAVALQSTRWVDSAVTVGTSLWLSRKSARPGSVQTLGAALTFLTRLSVWTAFVVVALFIVDVEVTGVIAGLGIGGVAAALAVQSVLGDLLASLSIYLDRPFDIGDLIKFEKELGHISKIGLRTTRMRSLWGQELVIPNSKLTSSLLKNYSRMRERRIVFRVGVTYETGIEQLEAIPGFIQGLIDARARCRFLRCHLLSFGAYDLVFEICYHVLSNDFDHYAEEQHDINLAIIRHFREAGIDFAYPTQSIHVQRADALNPEFAA